MRTNKENLKTIVNVLMDIELNNQFNSVLRLRSYLKNKNNPRPNPQTPGTVIRVYKNMVYVQVEDNWIGKKRDFTLTDKYGCAVMIYKECLTYLNP